MCVRQLNINVPPQYNHFNVRRLYRWKIRTGEPFFNLQVSKEFLQREIRNLRELGCPLLEKYWNFQKFKVNHSSMRRRVTLINQCELCFEKDFSGSYTWLNSYGVVQIEFAVVSINNYESIVAKKNLSGSFVWGNPYITPDHRVVLWRLEFFKTKCSQCERWGFLAMFECQLRAVSREFCRFLLVIMNGVPIRSLNFSIPLHEVSSFRNEEEHLPNRCEACALQKC